jgi:ribonuclease PH
MNFVMNEAGGFIEIQGTAEKNSFSSAQLQAMTDLAQAGIRDLIARQRAALSAPA